MMMRRRKRSAYTLLEIILALSIAILLLAALYGAVGYQLRQAQAGRDATAQTTLSRSILARVENDVNSSLSLCDSGRFRNQQKSVEAKLAREAKAAASGQAGGQSTTTQTTTTQTTTTQTTTTQGTSGQSSSGTESDVAAAETPDEVGMAGFNGPVVLPFGVVGNANMMTLYVSRVPGEAYQNQLVSDIRRISYWLGDGGQGLCRQEIRVATANEALADPFSPPPGEITNYLLAPEIKSLEFRYFDGASWVEEWDSRTLGGDKKTMSDGSEIGTPVGSPRAIEVRIGVLPAGGQEGDELKYYRHVIFIKTANGVTQATDPGTTP